MMHNQYQQHQYQNHAAYRAQQGAQQPDSLRYQHAQFPQPDQFHSSQVQPSAGMQYIVDSNTGVAYFYQPTPAMHTGMMTTQTPMMNHQSIFPGPYNQTPSGGALYDSARTAAINPHQPQMPSVNPQPSTTSTPNANTANSTMRPGQPHMAQLRSPRVASNSVNGVRMQGFVFPSPKQPQDQSTFPNRSVPHSATSSLASASSLPPKPNFLAVGEDNTAKTLPPFPAVSNPPHEPATVISGATNAKASGYSSYLTRGRAQVGTQLLEKLPPLPALPALRPAPPRLKHLEEAFASVSETIVKPSESDAAEESKKSQLENTVRAEQGVSDEDDVEAYVSSLFGIIQTYRAREEAMQLRIEALAFDPAASMAALQQQYQTPILADSESLDADQKVQPPNGSKEEESDYNGIGSSEDGKTHSPPSPASTLGVRLLRKVADLQQENEELGTLLRRKFNLTDEDGPSTSKTTQGAGVIAAAARPGSEAKESQHLKSELQDAHLLISAMSEQLKTADARVTKAEAALEFAVRSHSTAILETRDSGRGSRSSKTVSDGNSGPKRAATSKGGDGGSVSGSKQRSQSGRSKAP